MYELIQIQPNDNLRKFIIKNEDRTCELEISRRGSFKGIIEKIYSNGRYDVRLLEMIQESRE